MRFLGKIRRFATLGALFGMVLGCQCDSNDVSSLIRQARDGGSLKVRQDACSKLVDTPGSASAEALITLLSNDEHWYCAAHGLGLRKEKRAIAPLLMQLKDLGPRMDKYIWALGEIGDPSVLPRLLEVRRRTDASTAEGRRVERELELAVAKLGGDSN